MAGCEMCGHSMEEHVAGGCRWETCDCTVEYDGSETCARCGHAKEDHNQIMCEWHLCKCEEHPGDMGRCRMCHHLLGDCRCQTP